MKVYQYPTAAWALFGLLNACLPSAYAFDLHEAWQAAKTYSADYAAARYNRDAEAEQKYQARAALLPQVSANASYQKQPPSLSSTTSSKGWNIQASQVLYDKSRRTHYQQGKLAATMAEVKLATVENNLLADVAQAYFEVLLNQDKLLAIREEKAAYAEQVRQAQALFEKGAATIIDTHEAKAGYDAALAKEISTQSALLVAQNNLANLTGLNPEQITRVAADTQPDLLSGSKEPEWQKTAEANHPEWQLQKLALENAKLATLAARSGRLPKLSLNGGYQDFRNAQEYGGSEQSYRSKGSTLTLQLNVPLYSGGQISSQIRETVARERQSEEQLTATERKVKLAVKQAYQQTVSNHYQILAQQRLLKSSTAKLEATRLGRKVGVRSNLEEIQAQQNQADARQKLAEARYGHISAYIRLLQNSGVLNEPEQQNKIRKKLFH